MVDNAAVRLGRKGGRNSRKYLDPADATALARKAVHARWKAYYVAHPAKLKAKLEREAKKGQAKRASPPKKKTSQPR
jgi:hypothetical protein